MTASRRTFIATGCASLVAAPLAAAHVDPIFDLIRIYDEATVAYNASFRGGKDDGCPVLEEKWAKAMEAFHVTPPTTWEGARAKLAHFRKDCWQDRGAAYSREYLDTILANLLPRAERS